MGVWQIRERTDAAYLQAAWHVAALESACERGDAPEAIEARLSEVTRLLDQLLAEQTGAL